MATVIEVANSIAETITMAEISIGEMMGVAAEVAVAAAAVAMAAVVGAAAAEAAT